MERSSRFPLTMLFLPSMTTRTPRVSFIDSLLPLSSINWSGFSVRVRPCGARRLSKRKDLSSLPSSPSIPGSLTGINTLILRLNSCTTHTSMCHGISQDDSCSLVVKMKGSALRSRGDDQNASCLPPNFTRSSLSIQFVGLKRLGRPQLGGFDAQPQSTAIFRPWRPSTDPISSIDQCLRCGLWC